MDQAKVLRMMTLRSLFLKVTTAEMEENPPIPGMAMLTRMMMLRSRVCGCLIRAGDGEGEIVVGWGRGRECGAVIGIPGVLAAPEGPTTGGIITNVY